MPLDLALAQVKLSLPQKQTGCRVFFDYYLLLALILSQESEGQKRKSDLFLTCVNFQHEEGRSTLLSFGPDLCGPRAGLCKYVKLPI